MDHIANDGEGLAQQLIELEEKLLRAATRSSRKHVEELLGEGFFEFGSSGNVYDREMVISALLMEAPAAWSIANFKATALDRDVALVTYLATTGDGVSSLRCSVWKRNAGRWRMQFHQGTRIKPAT